jgi:hypothetical protein
MLLELTSGMINVGDYAITMIIIKTKIIIIMITVATTTIQKKEEKKKKEKKAIGFVLGLWEAFFFFSFSFYLMMGVAHGPGDHVAIAFSLSGDMFRH